MILTDAVVDPSHILPSEKGDTHENPMQIT
jgi:hypothetical protein